MSNMRVVALGLTVTVAVAAAPMLLGASDATALIWGASVGVVGGLITSEFIA